MASGGVYRLLRVFAGRRDLGISERGVPEPGACQRPESRQFHALDHERYYQRRVPLSREALPARAIRLFLGHDRSTVFRSPRRLPRNLGHHPGRHAEETRNPTMILRTALISVLFAGAASAGTPAEVKARIDAQIPDLLATYRDLHLHPELSHQEEHTSAFIAAELRKAGFTV